MCNQSGNTAYEGEGLVPKTLWRDHRFLGLPVHGRLAYLYLLTGPEFSPSGIFEVADESFRHGVTERATQWLDRLKESGLLREYEHTSMQTFIVWLDGVREYYSVTATPGQIAQMDRDVAKLDSDHIVVGWYLKEYGYGVDGLPVTQEMEAAVAQVTNAELLLFEQREHDFCGRLLDAGYTAEVVLACYGKAGPWYAHDWRGKLGQYPTMKTIGKTIKTLKPLVGVQPERKVDVDEVVEVVNNLLRHGKSEEEAMNKVIESFGTPVWMNLVAYKPWNGLGWKARGMMFDDIKWDVRAAKVNG